MLPNDDFKAGTISGKPVEFMLPEPYRGCFEINGPPGDIRRLYLNPRFVYQGEFSQRIVADAHNYEKVRWPQQPCITGEIEQTTVYGASLIFAIVWPSQNILRWVSW